MTRYVFAIDTKRCIGCNACSIKCRQSNNLPSNTWWTRALSVGGTNPDTPAGDYPNFSLMYLTVACQHCDNPACVKVCPVGATYKDPDTGAVRQDYDKCIGCRMCMSACPYTGVRSFNWEEPKHYLDFNTGSNDVPEHQKHVVEKCTMCWHKLAKGEEPACIEICTARARFWGDFDDPDSEVSQLIHDRECMQLLPEMGTNPSVYYLV